MTDRRVRMGAPTVVVDGDAHGGFWDLVEAGRWEPATTSVVATRAEPGMWFVDVGAWIGPLTLQAAARGAQVLAYEPDPVARAALEANLARNPELAARVEVRAAALGRRAGRAAIDGGPHGLGGSLSRLVRRGETVVEVLDAAVEASSEPFRSASLLKIDVEGAEQAVVPRLRRHLAAARPTVLLSLHGYDLRAWAEGRVNALGTPAERAEAAGAVGAVASWLRRRGRVAWARARSARRRLPVLWALRCYRTVAVALGPDEVAALGHGSPAAEMVLGPPVAAWSPLSRAERWLLAVRLADVELCCVDGPGILGP